MVKVWLYWEMVGPLRDGARKEVLRTLGACPKSELWGPISFSFASWLQGYLFALSRTPCHWDLACPPEGKPMVWSNLMLASPLQTGVHMNNLAPECKEKPYPAFEFAVWPWKCTLWVAEWCERFFTAGVGVKHGSKYLEIAHGRLKRRQRAFNYSPILCSQGC